MKRNYRVQQTINGTATSLEIDSQISGKKQVCLARLNGDARWDAAIIEIPGPRMDIVFGDDPSRLHGAGLTGDGHDAIHQHERLVRQTHPSRKSIDFGEGGS